jgi:hypothetical protein
MDGAGRWIMFLFIKHNYCFYKTILKYTRNMAYYLEKVKRFCYAMRESQARVAVLLGKTYGLMEEGAEEFVSISPVFATKGSC